MNIGNPRTTDHPAEFELGPAQPATDRYVDSDYQVESSRRVIRNRRKPMFDDGTRPGSKGSN